MDMSDIIAFGSFVVAILAALYARWAWSESKKANDIAIHGKQMEIYKSFDSLRFAMLQKACSITHEEVGKFYFPTRDSEFYFNEKIHKKVEEYFETCFELAEWSRKMKRSLTKEQIQEIHDAQDSLLEKGESLSKELDSLLKENLKLSG